MSASTNESVVIKKYANRRLYNTATSSYVTLENLAEMVKGGTEFNVYDAKSNDDITRAVLTQIIVEEEGKTGQNLLPIGFLRRLIGFYGNSMQWLVPKYLEHSLQSLTKNQHQIRDYYQTTFGNIFPFGNTLEEMSKQNMAMFERTMRMFSPFSSFTATTDKSATDTDSTDSTTTTTSSTSTSTTASTTTASTTCPTDDCAAKTSTNITELHPDTTTKSDDTATTTATTAPTPITPRATKKLVAVPTPETTKATAQNASGDDVQNKIAALQRQLSELAKKA